LFFGAEEQRRNKEVEISHRELAESIGVSKSSVQGAVGWLIRRKLIEVRKSSVTATPCYLVLSPWRKISQTEKTKRDRVRG
jgi:hypothetical protein